jgi:hypothetical protein
MNNFQPSQKANPLTGFMRQPKIYIKLPCDGSYWPEGSLELPENRELPVYSMTAKDELTFKTPDALLNGQAVIDVIQSCIPAIKNAWVTPSADLDAILIAIRIATYGETMEVSHKVPGTDEEVSHEINLVKLLDNMYSNEGWEEIVELNEHLTCIVRPLTYKHITDISLKTFETQKIMQIVNDRSLSDEQKLELFNENFNKMANLTITLAVDSIFGIQTPTDFVQDSEFIKEFLKNSDKEIFQKIQNHIETMKLRTGVQPITITSTPDLIEKGAPATYQLPISFDNSNFFGRGS